MTVFFLNAVMFCFKRDRVLKKCRDVFLKELFCIKIRLNGFLYKDFLNVSAIRATKAQSFMNQLFLVVDAVQRVLKSATWQRCSAFAVHLPLLMADVLNIRTMLHGWQSVQMDSL